MNFPVQAFLRKLKHYGEKEKIPNISLLTGTILQFFVRITQARNVFEIGCANGLSTIFLAEAVSMRDGTVVTCDISEPSFQSAKKNVAEAGFSQNVEFRFGSALDVVSDTELFDMIFIDGEKKRTHEFLLLGLRHLKSNGCIVIDDTKKFPEKMKPFFDMQKKLADIVFCDIPVDGDDAMTLCFRK